MASNSVLLAATSSAASASAHTSTNSSTDSATTSKSELSDGSKSNDKDENHSKPTPQLDATAQRVSDVLESGAASDHPHKTENKPDLPPQPRSAFEAELLAQLTPSATDKAALHTVPIASAGSALPQIAARQSANASSTPVVALESAVHTARRPYNVFEPVDTPTILGNGHAMCQELLVKGIKQGVGQVVRRAGSRTEFVICGYWKKNHTYHPLVSLAAEPLSGALTMESASCLLVVPDSEQSESTRTAKRTAAELWERALAHVKLKLASATKLKEQRESDATAAAAAMAIGIHNTRHTASAATHERECTEGDSDDETREPAPKRQRHASPKPKPKAKAHKRATSRDHSPALRLPVRTTDDTTSYAADSALLARVRSLDERLQQAEHELEAERAVHACAHGAAAATPQPRPYALPQPLGAAPTAPATTCAPPPSALPLPPLPAPQYPSLYAPYALPPYAQPPFAPLTVGGAGATAGVSGSAQYSAADVQQFVLTQQSLLQMQQLQQQSLLNAMSMFRR